MNEFLTIKAELDKELQILETLNLQKERTSTISNELKSSLRSEMQRIRLRRLPATHPLLKQSKDNQTILDQTLRTIAEKQALVDELRGKLAQLNVPQLQVSNLNDRIPVLLLPIRIQTRFMTIKHVTRNFDEKIVVDTGKTTLKADTTVAKRLSALAVGGPNQPFLFGTAVTGSSGKNEFNIVGLKAKAITTGRSTELPKTRLKKVEDKQELWLRIFPDEIFSHGHEAKLMEEEIDAGKAFWNRIHHIEQDPAIVESGDLREMKIAAWRILHDGYGAPRAAWIYRLTFPLNHSGDRDNELPDPPEFDTIEKKNESWTEAAHTYVLPDRFVVRFYNNGRAVREVIGNSIPSDLKLGLDPSDESVSQIEQQPSDIKFPEDLAWLTDFNAAEKVGMAIRIPLQTGEAKGFEKIIVLGVKTSANASQGKNHLEQLLLNHRFKSGGMSFIAQGTPTNNNDQEDSGFSSVDDDPEKSYDLVSQPNSFLVSDQYENKKDAQRLANALGIDHNVFQQVPNSDISDIREGIMMNHALFPATVGYFTKQFLHSYVTIGQRNELRDFMVQHVFGRGLLPALRIDEQPYGFLPATALSRWKASEKQFSGKLYHQVLKPLNNYWTALSSEVKSFGKPVAGEALDDKFLNILGLHATSVDYFNRPGQGPLLTKLIADTSGQTINQKNANALRQSMVSEGLTFAEFLEDDQILLLYLLKERKHLYGHIVDPLPLSESRTIQPFRDTDKNYIHWLEEASIDQIRNEFFQYFGSNDQPPAPRALLYLLLRHALLIEYIDTPINILKPFGEYLIPGDFEVFGLARDTKLPVEFENAVRKDVQTVMLAQHKAEAQRRFPKIIQEAERKTFIERSEPAVKVAANREADRIISGINLEQNQFNYLDKSFPGITGNLTMKEDLLDRLRRKDPAVKYLLNVKQALKTLKDLPTARLERLFAEHVDCCQYRVDAWINGLINERLDELRSDATHTEGIYLGAYGYLENVKPGNFTGISVKEITNPETVEVTGNTAPGGIKLSDLVSPTFPLEALNLSAAKRKALIKQSFVYLGSDHAHAMIVDPETDTIVPVPRRDSNNQGFIPTPSMAHAATAAVLRSGYEAHRKSGSPLEAFAVDISSMRVRTALYYLEGMRNGQPLNALLGYQFERGLHERNGTLTELDQYINAFREKYPLVAKNLTEPGSSAATGLQQARHVVDGLELLEKFREGGNGWASGTGLSGSNFNKVKAEVERLSDSMDAISDLLMAESVFQMAQGKPERAAAALRILSGNGEVLMPEVVNTPRSGHFLTHRVCLHFNLSKAKANLWGTTSSPRSLVEPALNAWLSEHLPSPEKIVIRAGWKDPETDDGTAPAMNFELVNMKQLKYQPIDFAYALHLQKDNPQASDIAVRIDRFLRDKHSLQPEQIVELRFTDRTGITRAQTSLFSLEPHVNALMEMVNSGRYLTPEDLIETNQTANSDPNSAIDPEPLSNRIREVIIGTNAVLPKKYIEVLKSAHQKIIGLDPEALPGDILTRVNALRQALLAMTDFGMMEAVPSSDESLDRASLEALDLQAAAILKAAEERLEEARTLWTEAQDTALSMPTKASILSDAARQIFGKAYRVFPEYRMPNAAAFQEAMEFGDLHADGGDMAVTRWLQTIGPVRPKMHVYQQSEIFDDMLGTEAAGTELTVVQLPHQPQARWMGMPYKDTFEPPNDTLSIVSQFQRGYTTTGRQAGILLDEWTEVIPLKEINTAVAMHFDQPNSEPPQTALLAVTPEVNGSWEWNDLAETINETMQLAKSRAVEPDHVLASKLSQVSPLTYAAVNTVGNTPSLDYGRNNPDMLLYLQGLVFQTIPNQFVIN